MWQICPYWLALCCPALLRTGSVALDLGWMQTGVCENPQNEVLLFTDGSAGSQLGRDM